MSATMIDVAIGVLMLFLVSSLIASAIVEAIGGLFHRRSKHLWDSLDLLLGNTSPNSTGEIRRIVDEVYRQPFVTELVRPKERDRLAKAQAKDNPLVVRSPANRVRPTQSGDALTAAAKARRYYGPKAIDAKEFAKALLAVVRPGGRFDDAMAAVKALDEAATGATAGDVAVASIEASLRDLDQAADELGSARLADAVASVRAAGATLSGTELAEAVGQMRLAVVALANGPLTASDLTAGLAALPSDLQARLISIVAEAGDDIAAVRTSIEQWYDRQMAAASSWYRKQTRYFLFATGLVFAAVANVDAVHATTTLYRDDDARAAIVAAAGELAAASCSSDAAAIELDCARETIGEAVAFPVGWSDAGDGGWDWVTRVVGWVLVAGAVTVGAPFWFDLLRRALVVRRGGSGD